VLQASSSSASRSSQDAYTAECQQLDPRPQPSKANDADQALEETVDRVAYILRCQIFRTVKQRQHDACAVYGKKKRTKKKKKQKKFSFT